MPSPRNTPPIPIRAAQNRLRRRWLRRFANLPPDARHALRNALLDLRTDARESAELQWSRSKAPMALYYKIISVYAGHMAAAIPKPPPQNPIPKRPGA